MVSSIDKEKARLTSELDGQVFVEGKVNLNFLTAGVGNATAR
jgi:hypothetical protein